MLLLVMALLLVPALLLVTALDVSLDAVVAEDVSAEFAGVVTAVDATGDDVAMALEEIADDAELKDIDDVADEVVAAEALPLLTVLDAA